MKLQILFGLFLVLILPFAALGQEVKNCDGDAVYLSGTLTNHKVIHEGNGEIINCLVLSLSKPILVKCDFVGETTIITEVQVVANETTMIFPEGAKVPDGAYVNVSGTLIPGETAWYCRNVGVGAKSVALIFPNPAGVKTSTPEPVTLKKSAAEPVMWDCQCACRCPSKNKPYDFEQPGPLCELPGKDPRLVAEETEALCREIVKSECRNSKCHCENCKAYDSQCGE
jgi:hypothetical protein